MAQVPRPRVLHANADPAEESGGATRGRPLRTGEHPHPTVACGQELRGITGGEAEGPDPRDNRHLGTGGGGR
ncbi:hypothetical protein NDU88_001704 [Pleurodeles waltl]|uniref:Uncharacterized protein n=1 Tax=Pleurodeles waltl TaxID=8319 RepID=A0AAV7S9I6_PLEWA|nr:hypothetical protein NDU88_001704 [Pleurodeles waltl]